MMKEIEFKISPDGAQVKIEGKGFAGKECLSNALTKNVKKAIGTVVDEKKKPEFYRTERSGQTIKG